MRGQIWYDKVGPVGYCKVTKNTDFRHLRSVFAREVYFVVKGIYNNKGMRKFFIMIHKKRKSVLH